MALLVDLIATLVGLLVGMIVQRYFILTSGEKKTNLPFIKKFNLLSGSKDIIFTNNKILSVNAHERHHELGDTFGAYFGQNMQIFTRDPDLIYKISVTDFQKHRNRYFVNSLSPYMRASLLEARDNDWQTSRRSIGAVLKASKLKMDNVDTIIASTIGKLLTSIEKRIQAAKEPVFDVYQMNKNFFMDSILKIIYDTHNEVEFDKEHNKTVEELHTFINVNYEAIARYCFLIPTLTDVVRPFLNLFDHGKCLGVLTDKLEGILRKSFDSSREKQSQSRLTTIHSLINSYRKGELSRQQLMGNAVFLMVAGFATSVDSMTCLLWQLAKNQDVQEKLRADLQQYGEESKYLEQCINETLRLNPGAMTNRDLSEAVYHKDFRMVKGACCNFSIYSLHRDPRYWGPDAEVWRPERFDPSKVAEFHPAQFIPFGIGPRNCVGYNLAKMEIIKFAVQLILNYKLETCSQTPSELEFVALGTLPFALPIKGPMHLKLTPITGN